MLLLSLSLLSSISLSCKLLLRSLKLLIFCWVHAYIIQVEGLMPWSFCSIMVGAWCPEAFAQLSWGLDALEPFYAQICWGFDALKWYHMHLHYQDGFKKLKLHSRVKVVKLIKLIKKLLLTSLCLAMSFNRLVWFRHFRQISTSMKNEVKKKYMSWSFELTAWLTWVNIFILFLFTRIYVRNTLNGLLSFLG
jgi:hypothetical protein